jgi:hypothetical protein
MTIDSILAEIDAEISRLTQARRLLASTGTSNSTTSKSRTVKPSAAKKARKKRVLSPDARKRIAEAQRRRWAAQKGKSKKES